MPLLPHETLLSLHAAAITAGLDRDSLLSGIDRRFVASIPRSASRAAQLLQDLQELAFVDRLADGSVPLRTWLSNAVRLSASRREEVVFTRALSEVEPGAVIPGRDDPAPPRPPSGAVRARIYLSAARQDLELLRRFRTHLAPLARQFGVDLWDRSQIAPGEDIRVAERRLDAANLVVLFLSSDFLASAETARETERALALRSTGARVVPVVARPCLWSSTGLDGLTTLPRNGRAITQHTDIDSALTGIAREVGAMIEDMVRAGASATSGADDHPEPHRGGRAPDAALQSVSSLMDASRAVAAAPPGTPLSDVFVRNGTPDLLYVEPAQARRIRSCLRVLGRGLVVEGPSKIGKTTTLRKAFEGVPPAWLDAYSDEGEIARLLGQRGLEGHTVIDNAHALPPDVLDRLARWLRVMADERAPRGKVTLVGIRGVARRLTSAQRDLVGRLDEVHMERQPAEKIRELVDLGERVARLRFEHKAEIVEASLGSFQLATMLCYECASAPPLDLDAVPAQETFVKTTVGKVQGEVHASLANQFDELALAFAKADAHTASPGAGLAFLWLLATSESDKDKVAFATLRREYPHLEPAWDFWEGGGHEAAALRGEKAGERAPDLRECARLAAGSLVSEDPVLRFYLRGLNWGELAEQAGVAIAWDETSGKLLVPVSRPGAPLSHLRSLYEEPSYPFWRPDAVTLRDLLVGAYPNVEQVGRLGQTAGIHLGRWTRAGGAIEPAWDSLLEIATQQSKLEALMNRVLADGGVRSYERAIRATLAALGVPQPEA